jgi:SOS-response transcriptional repressor LexA
VQLADPVPFAGLSVAEVVESAALVAKWPDAFALRIDGDSMLPILRENDLAIVSPKVRARNGHAAIVQLAGQIGVTCKVYRHVRRQVRLIPANPSYPTTVHPKDAVVWALQVLARVRAPADRTDT